MSDGESPIEPIEGPASTPRADLPPSFFEDASRPKTPKAPIDAAELAADINESKDAVVSIISEFHDLAAKRTGYTGFALTPNMESAWKRLTKAMLKRLPIGDWPLFIAAASLGMGYLMMGLGYIEWRKGPKNERTEPTKAPTEQPESAIEGNPPLLA